MLSKIWTWILEKLFHVSTETKQKDVEDNTKYAVAYERISVAEKLSKFTKVKVVKRK